MGIKKFFFGKGIKTNSVIKDINYSDISEINKYLDFEEKDSLIILKKTLAKDERIYGLGENVKGINKRGSSFKSFNLDDPVITEDRRNLYASHNFLIFSNKLSVFALFIDTPKVVDYDLGFTHLDRVEIKIENGFDLYIIESNDIMPELEVTRKFREIIGESYIAPLFAFGVAQSRWGYKTKEDLLDVINGFNDKDLPLDMLFFDIDCLDEFKDFTFNDTFYKDGEIDLSFFKETREKGIHLVPIVDAGVKVKDGYFLYDELIKNGGAVKDKDGKEFIVGVWPGDSILPDFLSKEGHDIFGAGYKKYLDLGLDAFWNDMNEPALFYGKDNLLSFGKFLKNIFQ